MVIACLALAVALGGTAAITLPKNSVGAPQLKKNAVVSSKVKNHSLKAADFAAGELPKGPKGDTGATGATGAAGTAGAKSATGATGAAGATNVVRRYAYGPTDATTSQANVSCNPGEVATGGGVDVEPNAGAIPVVSTSAPTPCGEISTPTGWFIAVQNINSPTGTIRALAWVICASP
jgi:hypothetical protein